MQNKRKVKRVKRGEKFPSNEKKKNSTRFTGSLPLLPRAPQTRGQSLEDNSRPWRGYDPTSGLHSRHSEDLDNETK